MNLGLGLSLSGRAASGGGAAISYSVSTIAALVGATNVYTFTIIRSGDTSGSSTATWVTSPTALGGGRVATVASDFPGSTYPSGTANFTAGQTSKTITFTGSTAVFPE